MTKPSVTLPPMANSMRGRGDYMGLGALNDNADITADVHANFPTTLAYLTWL